MKNFNYNIWKWRMQQKPIVLFILRINLAISKILFHWYYKRAPIHFHSWPFFKSVKILIENYKHTDEWRKSSDKMLGEVIKENTKLYDKINLIELKKLIDESQVDFLNTTFGLNIPKASDN